MYRVEARVSKESTTNTYIHVLVYKFMYSKGIMLPIQECLYDREKYDAIESELESRVHSKSSGNGCPAHVDMDSE